jgi:hypothetical protein
MDLERLLDHKTLAKEMRHTSNVVRQFSIAVVTLQGGAIARVPHSGFTTPGDYRGRCCVLPIGVVQHHVASTGTRTKGLSEPHMGCRGETS